MRLHPFELTAVDIAGVDVDHLHALSIGVGWPHRPADWAFLTGIGQGFAALDDIGRVLGSAMWFPYTDGFATVGMVITSPRLQARGAGAWLTGKVLAAAGDRAIGLNATRAASRLYRSLGFAPERPVLQYQGEVGRLRPEPPALSPGSLLRGFAPADLPALVALDAPAFGVPRESLLRRLTGVSQGTVLARDGRVQAFALCRPFGRGSVIGPVVATCDADAAAVVAPHLAGPAGRFIRIDTRAEQGAFTSFLARCGLSLFDTVETMSLRGPWLARRASRPAPAIYGLASQALG